MVNNYKIEICCGCIDDVIIASKYPIDRIELNSSLELGGITPTIATLKQAKKITNVPICCMVRNRGAGFNYTKTMIDVMYQDAINLLENGADGIVFGFLTNDRKVDKDITKKFANLAHKYHAEAIYHKAFDEIEDLDQATIDLIDCGIDRILTSGKSVYPNILSGCATLKQLHQKYKDKIQYLIGGGIRVNNIVDALKQSTLLQVHMTSKKTYTDITDYVSIDEEQLIQLLDQIKTID